MLKQLASMVTQKALFQAEAIAKVTETCGQSTSYRNLVDFHQAKGKPLRCTYTHVVEGVKPSRRWVLNVAALQKKAEEQVAAIKEAIEASRSMLALDSDLYKAPTSANDFYEDQNGELYFRYLYGGTELTMQAAVVVRYATGNLHHQGVTPGGEGGLP